MLTTARLAVAWLAVALSAMTAPLQAQARTDSTRHPPVPDSVAVREAEARQRDSLAQARVDSIYRARLADTLKAPLAHFERPDVPEWSDRMVLSKQEILQSGAVTLADLLDRVPGVTTYRSRWLAGLHLAAFNGDFRRIRVFFDGVERDAIEPRQGGVLDLTDVPIWTVDEIVIERTAGEVRVWLRGWTVRRTTPQTRVDIVTGDLNTNGFRALFARRFGNGLSLQFVGQQMSTQSGRVSAFTTSETATGAGDGDVKFVDMRVGWARGRFTADVHALALSRLRDPHTAREGFTNLPGYRGSRREGYARLAYGDSARGFWAQAIAGALTTRLQGVAAAAADEDTTIVSRDTLRTRNQGLLVAGYRARGWHVSVLDRARRVDSTVYHAPAIRAGIGTERYGIAAYGEQRGLDSLRQVDLSAWARPTSWLRLVATQSNRTPDDDTLRSPLTSRRAELAVRVGRLWFGGGVVQDGGTEYDTPIVIGAPQTRTPTVSTTGLLGSVSGALYKDLRLETRVIRWDVPQYSRPRTSVRNELSLVSNWLSRFPKGQFTINMRVIHDVRDPVPFYWTATDGVTQRVADDAQVVTAQLEIRIQSASIFYQYRNLTGRAYEQLPGLTMPPAVQIYGVRWEFWN